MYIGSRISGLVVVVVVLILLVLIVGTGVFNFQNGMEKFTLYPIGEVKKEGDRSFLVIDKKYEAGILGLEHEEEIIVVYWFDRNDDPTLRSTLRVHPKGDPQNPIRGVFATHSPVRPNLIAISRCKIISIRDNIIEIDTIDALDRSPLLDIKN